MASVHVINARHSLYRAHAILEGLVGLACTDHVHS